MSTPLIIALLVLGFVLGLIIKACSPEKPKPRSRPRINDNLDTVDQMYLYGEVTGDDFYRM